MFIAQRCILNTVSIDQAPISSNTGSDINLMKEANDHDSVWNLIYNMLVNSKTRGVDETLN